LQILVDHEKNLKGTVDNKDDLIKQISNYLAKNKSLKITYEY